MKHHFYSLVSCSHFKFEELLVQHQFCKVFKHPIMKQQPAKITAMVITIFLFCFCLSLSSFAQWSVGLEGGYTRNYLQTNNANRDFTNYTPGNGFSVGVPVHYKLSNWFAIAAEPGYIQKNYLVQRSSFYAGTYQTSTNSYLQLPIMAHFMFGGEKIHGFFNIGGYGGYWLSGNVKGTIPNILNPVANVTATNTYLYSYNPYNYNEKYTFDTHRDNRLEIGWIAGAGVSYALNDKYSLFAEGRMMQSITDMQKNYMVNQTPRYNNTYGANLGIMVSFGKKTTNNQ